VTALLDFTLYSFPFSTHLGPLDLHLDSHRSIANTHGSPLHNRNNTCDWVHDGKKQRILASENITNIGGGQQSFCKDYEFCCTGIGFYLLRQPFKQGLRLLLLLGLVSTFRGNLWSKDYDICCNWDWILPFEATF